jgi:hypothetical protein
MLGGLTGVAGHGGASRSEVGEKSARLDMVRNIAGVLSALNDEDGERRIGSD